MCNIVDTFYVYAKSKDIKALCGGTRCDSSWKEPPNTEWNVLLNQNISI